MNTIITPTTHLHSVSLRIHENTWRSESNGVSYFRHSLSSPSFAGSLRSSQTRQILTKAVSENQQPDNDDDEVGDNKARKTGNGGVRIGCQSFSTSIIKLNFH